jgi:hypothetical protein
MLTYAAKTNSRILTHRAPQPFTHPLTYLIAFKESLRTGFLADLC